MDIAIEIKGKVSIPSDDLKRLEAEGPGELAGILLRHGHEVTARVSEVYVKELAKVR